MILSSPLMWQMVFHHSNSAITEGVRLLRCCNVLLLVVVHLYPVHTFTYMSIPIKESVSVSLTACVTVLCVMTAVTAQGIKAIFILTVLQGAHSLTACDVLLVPTLSWAYCTRSSVTECSDPSCAVVLASVWVSLSPVQCGYRYCRFQLLLLWILYCIPCCIFCRV